MCGVTGFFHPGGLDPSAQGELEGMIRRIKHRGPDAGGTWIDAEAGVALGHRRLSILDLSEAGGQPMVSHSGRYVLVTNGEIYNHLEIRVELDSAGDSPSWRGHSDTETMVAAFDRWGIERTISRLVGMFAFAVWDRHERVLTLARDRLGEKPLYYGYQDGTLLFGSELKALRAHRSFHAPLDRTQLQRYMLRGYVPAPASIYAGISKLRPGCFLRVRQGDTESTQQAYWTIGEVAARGEGDRFSGSADEALAELESVLGRAVASQSVADVPLGAFLSGGVDSSAVVALMQAQSSRRVCTFSIGFTDPRFDEAPFARSVAAHLGTSHTELVVTAREAMSVVPRLPSLYDEPFGDSSAIPTFLVAELARRHVTVALSGDGGDEIFSGYTRYRRAELLWNALRRVPKGLRPVLAKFVRRHHARFVRTATNGKLYDALMLDPQGGGLVLGASGSSSSHSLGLDPVPAHRTFRAAMMLSDLAAYLPDDILVKVDRASMGVGLECRVPMLDHRVVEFAWRLPDSMRYRGGESKWLLRRLLHKYVPARLLDRPKRGFAVPVDDWVRTSMRDWAESLIDADGLRNEGFFDVARVRALWSAHLSGTPLLGPCVWRVFMFQAWLRSASPK